MWIKKNQHLKVLSSGRSECRKFMPAAAKPGFSVDDANDFTASQGG
ncbi:hypothetical protein Pvag_pPag20155 (plasmid) [Pantoea vagans C9-1]|nr:hypothetical protein Pvag_pPag20155 [Pantoea vagans C9-1]